MLKCNIIGEEMKRNHLIKGEIVEKQHRYNMKCAIAYIKN